MSGNKTESLIGAPNRNKSIDSTQIIVSPPSSLDGRRRKKSGKVTFCDLIRGPDANRTALYVLFLCLITYMFSQVDRYLQAITAEDMQQDQGWGNGKGGGYEEDLLVGAVFTVVYLPSGIPFGFIADRFPRKKKLVLAMALFLWSAATFATGFSSEYWEVMTFRFILAIGQSACTPLAGSIISDHFSRSARTTALGIYNWGIYTGYSLAYGAANAMNEETSWRTVWWVFGAGGMVWSALVLTIPTAHRPRNNSVQAQRRKSSGSDPKKATVCSIVKYFVSTPSLIILLIASLIRNAGGMYCTALCQCVCQWLAFLMVTGYVWAYNAATFFENVDDQSGDQQAVYMQWIPLIGGCFGALFGGFISDRFVKKSEPWKRLLILVASNVIAAPFAFFALVLPAPWCYLMLIGSNVIGEMWVGICIALVIELVPSAMKTTALSIYVKILRFVRILLIDSVASICAQFLWIGIGGFFPLLVTPIQTFFCGDEPASCNKGLQWALIILFPGLYLLSSLIFFVSLVFLKRDTERARRRRAIPLHTDNDEGQ